MSSNPPINLNCGLKVLQLWVLWLVLSLLLSQSLGQLHAVKHGGLGAAAHVAGEHEAHDTHHDHDHDDDDDGFLKLLFSSHGSASDCRLYDHLNDVQAMPPILATPWPTVLPSPLVAIFSGDALARWTALFDARGPPLTS